MNNIIDVIIGSNLFRLRMLRGLTQSELERITGISRSVISRYETGSMPVYAKDLYKLARALKVSVNGFYWFLR